jgi:hypothetical protein
MVLRCRYGWGYRTLVADAIDICLAAIAMLA